MPSQQIIFVRKILCKCKNKAKLSLHICIDSDNYVIELKFLVKQTSKNLAYVMQSLFQVSIGWENKRVKGF